MSAVEQWAEHLAGWAIPGHILAAAPESPFTLPGKVFVRRADRQIGGPRTPTHRSVLAALDGGGTLLDVGAGAGAASLPCAEAITHVTAVDTNLLEEFAERAEMLGLPHRTVEGRWPNAAAQAGTVDVTVCANVLYNVPDLEPFVRALNEHTRRAVVVELNEHHPMTRMSPLWERFHGIHRPGRPTSDDAVAALRELGVRPEIRRWQEKAAPIPFPELVETTRKRLCLGVDRADEVADALRGTDPGIRRMTTVTWSPERTL
ncbi:methyltransferase domain-containing protein [Amycolatopsis acidicola]|uniref:Methyltransferase domain-containing protein n=1 Tax=Amycolatopsis acidicola TaxID=2596893 RepID=A0A5N0V849_9PSEU|nr:methyltransferase domain-containing protein [Amycolatopsis acidicola]KAA9161864.1 methyltransferase domain-containing protein [Amycolatopsis acidicola]